MESVKEENKNINKFGLKPVNSNNNASNGTNEDVPRTVPKLNLSININAKNNEEEKESNFVADSEEQNENEDGETSGNELKKIVPGSVVNKIKQFEIIEKEKKVEKLPPGKLKRAFRDRVNSTQLYKRESLMMLTSPNENNLRIQTVINKLYSSQNEDNIPDKSVTSPVSARISSYRNQLSNNEMTMETFLQKIREDNGEVEESSEDNKAKEVTNENNSNNSGSENNNKDEEKGHHLAYGGDLKRQSDVLPSVTRNIDREKRFTTRSQDSPLKIASNLENDNFESNDSITSDNHPDSSSQQNNNSYKSPTQEQFLSNNDINDNSENEDSLVKPILTKRENIGSDTQLNNISGIKMVKKQFVRISSKKNSKANIKSIHIKGSSEQIKSASQENLKNSWDSLYHQGSISDESINSINNSRNFMNDHGIRVKEVHPLEMNKKMQSDTYLYNRPNERQNKPYVVTPTILTKKPSMKSCKPVELKHVTKKTSVSTIDSDDSTSQLSDKAQSTPHFEKRMSRMYEYDADILYEYFDEGSDEDENLISDSASEAIKEQNNKVGKTLSIRTDIKHNNTALNSCETGSAGITSLDQVYNTISQELEERLCKTVRQSTLQRVDSKNFMVPINILYEKHYKTQVIYVERKMTIEEVLQQALNSINIYEDYGNYELLQVFGFEDIIEEEEENETDKNGGNDANNTKYQNVLDPMSKIQEILEETTKNTSKRKTNNILTFRIRKKSSTMKIPIYLEEEKKYYTVMVTRTTTCAEVIESLLFLQNEPYSENGWYIERKNLDNYEGGKEILEATDDLYNKEENFKYTLKRKRTKQMSKLANILGVTDESDLHNIVDNKDKKSKDKDKASKSMNELIKVEPLKDNNDELEEITDEKLEMFSRILSIPKNEISAIFGRNKKLNERKKMEAKKKFGSVDQLSGGNPSTIKDGERFSSQVFSIFKSKKDKRNSKFRDSNTGSMPLLNLKDDPRDSDDLLMSKYGASNDCIDPNDSDEENQFSGKRAKKLGNFFGVKPSQRENTELNNIIRKNYNSKKALDSSQQYVVIRVYFANLTFTTVNMSINDTCKTLKKILCEKLGVKESDEGLYQIYEFTQKNGYEREVHNSERPFDTMRRWQKDEIFLFKLKNTKPTNRNIYDRNKSKAEIRSPKSPMSARSETSLHTPEEPEEQPVRRMAKLAGFFGVMNSKQEEKNNVESESEVKELFNMLHVISNSKDEATKQIINFIHSKDVIVDNSVKEGWLHMQVGKCWINSWCYKDNNGGFIIKNWKSGDIMRIVLSDIVSAELADGKTSGSTSDDNVFQIVVKKDGCGVASHYLFKAKFVVDAIEWVTSLKPAVTAKAKETQKVVIEDDSNFKDNFDAMNIIGKGKYSVVFLCKQLSTQEPYAVKILNSQYKEMWEVEKEILKSITHPFIVDIFQAFEYEDHNYLVMDFVNGGDLYFHLSQYGRFSEIRIRFYAAEILLALESLHGRDIIYRDLKLENIMITKEGHVKLIDFGQSVPKLIMNVDEVSSMSNIEYIAPEILCGKSYSYASDWWAYGVILYEMLCEKHPFYSNQKEEIVQRILQSSIEFPSFPSRYIKDLILKLLNRDSEKRLGCSSDGGKEIQNHSFFDKIDFTKLYHLEIKPPFKPNVTDPFDIQYFDTQFTEEPISNNISEGNLYDENYSGYDDNYEGSDDYNYEGNYDEDNYSEINEEEQQQRLNNGWGSDDDEDISKENQFSGDSNNYTDSYIEKQEQRLKNGW